jgi:hypothetical protein
MRLIQMSFGAEDVQVAGYLDFGLNEWNTIQISFEPHRFYSTTHSSEHERIK